LARFAAVSHGGELVAARAKMVVARADLAVSPPANATIHDVDADEMDFLPDDEEGEDVSDEQRALLALFESLPRDANRLQSLASEAQARGDALAMRQVYVCSDPAPAAWRGHDHTQINQENRELEEAIAARDEAAKVAAMDITHYHADVAAVAVEEMARVEVAEEQARVAA
jgi:hypothetical protein